ncbi:Imm32 family immunity protein [Paludisphaera mucosa]|uniref:Uncharacterized protein n=1 Tax=Paludisphaera mucosa TaxID=3030827 RepID=A0ABT6FIK1_9BACT|nr:hypothetical protein [Paludisphaera mucosa]MDG3007413.1 hypothetical protein [Paludisphaera mucosa]
MPAYGYQRAVVDAEYGLLELREVSFDLSPDGLRRLATFLRECADRAEAGDLRSGHVHIEEFDRAWRRVSPDLDVVVLRR